MGTGRDAGMREMAGRMPPAELEPVATVAPPLAEAKVAIVTTAGLTTDGATRLWSLTDGSFTVVPAGARDLRLSHFSPNFDRSGFTADLNVVFPVDRLDELAAAGTIGSVNHRHLSFMGAQFDLSTIVLDSGPAAAQLLLDDEVDVVLLTPV